MSVPSFGRAVRYHEHGEPGSVLKLEEVPVPAIGAGEVLVEMQAATIHPSDIGLINGSYGRLRQLPAVGGREGVGKVVSVGSGVDEKILQRPVAMPDDQGAWQDYVKMQADDLILLPALVPFDQLALSIINPLTAWRLLNDFEYLKEGDFIIQNAGNSAVGLSVVQFAKKLGLTLISLVRNEERKSEMIDFGAQEVWIDDDDVPEKVKELTAGKGCVLGMNRDDRHSDACIVRQRARTNDPCRNLCRLSNFQFEWLRMLKNFSGTSPNHSSRVCRSSTRMAEQHCQSG